MASNYPHTIFNTHTVTEVIPASAESIQSCRDEIEEESPSIESLGIIPVRQTKHEENNQTRSSYGQQSSSTTSPDKEKPTDLEPLSEKMKALTIPTLMREHVDAVILCVVEDENLAIEIKNTLIEKCAMDDGSHPKVALISDMMSLGEDIEAQQQAIESHATLIMALCTENLMNNAEARLVMYTAFLKRLRDAGRNQDFIPLKGDEEVTMFVTIKGLKYKTLLAHKTADITNTSKTFSRHAHRRRKREETDKLRRSYSAEFSFQSHESLPDTQEEPGKLVTARSESCYDMIDSDVIPLDKVTSEDTVKIKFTYITKEDDYCCEGTFKLTDSVVKLYEHLTQKGGVPEKFIRRIYMHDQNGTKCPVIKIEKCTLNDIGIWTNTTLYVEVG